MKGDLIQVRIDNGNPFMVREDNASFCKQCGAAWSIMSDAALSARRSTAINPLSEQERKVLYLLWEGLQRKEIAWVMGISPKTVHNYTCTLYRKLGVHNAVQAVRFGIEHEWIEVRR